MAVAKPWVPILIITAMYVQFMSSTSIQIMYVAIIFIQTNLYIGYDRTPKLNNPTLDDCLT